MRGCLRGTAQAEMRTTHPESAELHAMTTSLGSSNTRFSPPRRLLPEIMDQPDLDPGRHLAALNGLARINWVSRIAQTMASALIRYSRATGERTLCVLDLASGGGDVTLGIWRRARRAGLHLEITGCDMSPTAIQRANDRARSADAPIEFIQCNVLADPLPGGCHVVMSSLFLHHLDEQQAVCLLTRMREHAARLVLLNDLRRGTFPWLLALAATRLLTRSDVVHVDGPRSVAGAFTMEEARNLCERAGLAGASLRRSWPYRYLITWRKPA